MWPEPAGTKSKLLALMDTAEGFNIVGLSEYDNDVTVVQSLWTRREPDPGLVILPAGPDELLPPLDGLSQIGRAHV